MKPSLCDDRMHQGIGEFRTMRGTRDMDYVWCPLREDGLFNFTDDQLLSVLRSACAQLALNERAKVFTIFPKGLEAI